MRRFFKKKGLFFLVGVFLSFCFFFVGTQSVSSSFDCDPGERNDEICGHELNAANEHGIYQCVKKTINPPSGPVDVHRWEYTGSHCPTGQVCIMGHTGPQCTTEDSPPESGGDCSAGEVGNTKCYSATEIWRCETTQAGAGGTSIYAWRPYDTCGANELCKASASTATCEEVDEGDVTPPTPDPNSSGNGEREVTPLPDTEDPPKIDLVWDILNRAASYIISFIAIVAVAMVIYGAYMWMGSAGDPEKVKSAQGILTWAILGLVFFIILFLVFRFVLALFGIEGFEILEF